MLLAAVVVVVLAVVVVVVLGIVVVVDVVEVVVVVLVDEDVVLGVVVLVVVLVDVLVEEELDVLGWVVGVVELEVPGSEVVVEPGWLVVPPPAVVVGLLGDVAGVPGDDDGGTDDEDDFDPPIDFATISSTRRPAVSGPEPMARSFLAGASTEAGADSASASKPADRPTSQLMPKTTVRMAAAVITRTATPGRTVVNKGRLRQFSVLFEPRSARRCAMRRAESSGSKRLGPPDWAN
ncbi:MAG: hypothetical protein DWQ20_08015 [Actinobacteria bacterium]|nr:MAG: hypothetical protein DWQ20_08015 [Actinomycetota bacterium]